MQRDLRNTPLYREAQTLMSALRAPGSGRITDGSDLAIHPQGTHAVLAGSDLESLERAPKTRIVEVELATGDLRSLSLGAHMDRSPKYDPSGKEIAFLSDRAGAGDYQLYRLDRKTAAARAAPSVDGWVEYLH